MAPARRQHASFNSLEGAVDREQRRTEHTWVVLARERELSDAVARLKRELAEERTAFENEASAARWLSGTLPPLSPLT